MGLNRSRSLHGNQNDQIYVLEKEVLNSYEN